MNTPNSKLNEWLENLQRESWNLELIISGFSIFLLFKSTDVLSDALMYLSYQTHLEDVVRILIVSVLGTLYIGISALIVNLIIHVFLRAVWIGAIGLRSVQEDIDYEKLNYSPFFTEKLKKRVQSLDNMIVRLDTICSVIFSFTFLVFFMLLSFVLYFAVMLVLIKCAMWITDFFEETLQETLAFVLFLVIAFYNVLGLFYFIDTLTTGFFKKYHRLSRLYYPIYRFFNFITFSRLYQSIYYILLSRFSKWRLALILAVYLFVVFNLPFVTFNQFTFFPDTLTEVNFDSKVYDNLRAEEGRIQTVSIPSDMVRTRFLPVFINYKVSDNEAIKKLCTDYEPSKKNFFISGITFDNGIKINTPSIKEENPASLLRCLSQYYKLYINDSLYANQEYYFYQHPNQGEKGVRTVVDIGDLPKGKNVLTVLRKNTSEADTLKEKAYGVVPFWLE